ncbi:MAG: hypothetical protein H7832_15460 [Magnetococcus sp. DMHC-6]
MGGIIGRGPGIWLGDGIGWVAFLFGLSGLADGAEWWRSGRNQEACRIS